jgi:hypothetical protein
MVASFLRFIHQPRLLRCLVLYFAISIHISLSIVGTFLLFCHNLQTIWGVAALVPWTHFGVYACDTIDFRIDPLLKDVISRNSMRSKERRLLLVPMWLLLLDALASMTVVFVGVAFH